MTNNIISSLKIIEKHFYPETWFSAWQLPSKLNSNPYHYQLKFILTSKQKYNSKFEEFETVRTLRIQNKRTNLDKKNFLGSTIMRNQQKRSEPFKTPSFFFFVFFLYFETSNGFEFLKFRIRQLLQKTKSYHNEF